MELKAGYKQTEVGLIPEDWDVKNLAELCRQIVDGTHFTPTYTRSGVPFYSVENVTANDFENVKFISKTDHEMQNKRCNPEKGDILMTRIGSLGDTRIIDWDVQASIYVSLALLKVGESLNPHYLYAYSRSHVFRQCVENRSLLSAIPKKINMGAIGDVPVPIPPSIEEQRAIANALGDADALIASLDALIAKKCDLKQAVMQQLLTGKTRLPGFAGEWEVKRLGDVANIKTGKRNNQDKQEDGAYPFFVRSENVERISSFSHDCEAILIPGEGNIGRIFHYIVGKFDVHQRVYAITNFIDGVSGRFVHLWMRMNFGAHAMQNTVKATVDSLRLPTFQNFELMLPPTLAEQTAIAEALSDMDTELAELEAQRNKSLALQQGMMQELLTGRIRLV